MTMGRNFGSDLAASSCCRKSAAVNPEAILNLRKAFLQRLRVIAEQQDAEGRIAVHQDAAFAIQHRPARRNDRDRANAVAFGQIGKVTGLHDLKFPEADHEKHDDGHQNVRNQCKAALGNLLVVNAPRWQSNSLRDGVLVPSAPRKIELLRISKYH